jgi:hypothetical protein
VEILDAAREPSGVRALEVRIREQEASVDVNRFTEVLEDIGATLREIDRLYLLEARRPRWVVEDLTHQDRTLAVRLTARPGSKMDRSSSSMLAPVGIFVRGAQALRSAPEVPTMFTERTVERVLEIARPGRGIDEISVATVNGRASSPISLSGPLITNAREAVRSHEESWGTVAGTLDILSRMRTRDQVRLSVFDSQSARAIAGIAPPSMSDELRNAWGRRVLLGGPIARNARGQAVRIKVVRLEILGGDVNRASVAELLGVAPDWTGDLSVDDYMAEARRA